MRSDADGSFGGAKIPYSSCLVLGATQQKGGAAVERVDRIFVTLEAKGCNRHGLIERKERQRSVVIKSCRNEEEVEATSLMAWYLPVTAF